MAWIRAIVLAGAQIGSGSVVGAASIVTRRIPNNAVAVGSPAKVVRRHVAWERPHLGLVPPYCKADSSTVTKSRYWSMTVEEERPPRFRMAKAALRRMRTLRRR